jgi:hypothetical protein
LKDIAIQAMAVHDGVDPDHAARQGLDQATITGYKKQLQDLTAQTEKLVPDVTKADAAVVPQLRITQDTLVGAYQMLSVYYADRTLQNWSNAGSGKAEQRQAYHDESGGGAATKDWCGMFVDAQYRAAGMNAALNRVLNSTLGNARLARPERRRQDDRPEHGS